MTSSSGYTPHIRLAEPADTAWIATFLCEHWHATVVAVHGELIDAATLPALIAENQQGLATYRLLGREAELVTPNAKPEQTGVGTALIDVLVARLVREGCERGWLATTNDNLSALRFYQRRGFRLMQVRPSAVDRARRLKPSIPRIGQFGIMLCDETDLCRELTSDTTEDLAPPWSRSSPTPAE